MCVAVLALPHLTPQLERAPYLVVLQGASPMGALSQDYSIKCLQVTCGFHVKLQHRKTKSKV